MTVAMESTAVESVEDFARRAGEWLASNAPRADDEGARQDADSREWQGALQRRLFDAGFAGITWPTRYGGAGLTDHHRLAFLRVAQGYRLPTMFGMGEGLFGPTVMALGAEEQKDRLLPRMINGDDVYCQLFSEPGAGSDVAGLRTRAVRDGDEWVVNGQKTWSSGARDADLGVLIARTDPTVPKHNGISMFVVDMRAPGVQVVPLVQATGEAPFNNTFLDDVRLPADALVGEENAGWAAAVVMLRNERISIGTGTHHAATQLTYDAVLAVARKAGRTSDPVLRCSLAAFYALDRSRVLLGQRLRQETDAGHEIRARGSIGKLAGAVIARAALDVIDEAGGSGAIAWDGTGPEYPAPTFGVIAASSMGIRGGTNEIQRGIIGERVLGLAKEPQVDREIPFNQVRANGDTRTLGR
ncbi:MAG: dehydrogenase [Jatrophihabitantaceae bacterium]|nr:dehydrogenase [Jatrophihabitantaceae bacterium]